MNLTKITTLVLITCAFASLAFPYLLKLDNVSTEDPGNVGYGFEMRFPVFSLLTLVAAFMLAFTSTKLQAWLWTLYLSIFNLGIVWLVRLEIHSQGFIDHEYDSRTGPGFLILFVCSLGFVLLAAMNAYKLRKKKMQ